MLEISLVIKVKKKDLEGWVQQAKSWSNGKNRLSSPNQCPFCSVSFAQPCLRDISRYHILQQPVKEEGCPQWAFPGDDSCSKGCDVLLEEDNIWFPSSFSMLIRVWVSRNQHLRSPHFINQDFVNQREAYWLLLQLKSGKPSPHCSRPHHFSHEWRGDPFMLLTVHAVIFPETIRINLSILLTLFMSPQEA